MSDPLSNLEIPPISASLALAIEDAAIAISRLDARASVSPVLAGWLSRAAWTGYAKAVQLQGGEIDEIDVFSWACALPLPSRPRRTSHNDEFGAFASWLAILKEKGGPEWRDRLPFTPTAQPGAPTLLRAISHAHTFARRDESIAPWLALPDILRGLGVTQTALPCLVGGAKAFRWRATLSEDIRRPILRALASAAEEGLVRLDAMEADYRRGIAAVQEQYRRTSLAPLIALIAARPLLSPQSVAAAMDLTIGGAGKLLSKAADLDLLVEITGRRAWRIYLAPDLAVRFGFVSGPRGRPRKTTIAPIPDRSLASALDAFDREMAEIDKRLAALN